MGYRASERVNQTNENRTSSRVSQDGKVREDSSQNTTNYYTGRNPSSQQGSQQGSRDIFNDAVNYIQKNAAPYVKKGAQSLQKGGESLQKSAQNIQNGVTRVVNSVATAAEAKSAEITQSYKRPVVVKRKVKKSLLRKGVGKFMIAFGAVFLLPDIVILNGCFAGTESVSSGIVSAALAIFNAGLIINGILRNKNAVRYLRYLNIIQGRQSISLSELSQRASIRKNKIITDLRKMFDAGLLGTEAEIDTVHDVLILSSAGKFEAENFRKNSEELQRRAEIVEGDDDSEKQILILEELSSHIKDGQMSALVFELASLSKKIIAHRDESPDEASKLYMFLSYYLPTTVKLAKKYDELEHQNISGENITSIMENIKESLGSTKYSFEQKLDELYRDDMLDIKSDISVMEQMLAREGITGKKDR